MITYRQPFKKEWPITQKYGEKITSSFHTGIDYGCPFGTNILASGEGTVMFAAWDTTGYGNVVIIRHTLIASTLYAHLSDVSVKVGQYVHQGELIGHSGNTGNSTGPHLHFEARMTWNDYKSHFDPMILPLTSVDDSVPSKSDDEPLLNAVDLHPGPVKIVCSDGAFVHTPDFSGKQAFPNGSTFTFHGIVKMRDGLEFCQVLLPFWVAVNDGETQILMNTDQE